MKYVQIYSTLHNTFKIQHIQNIQIYSNQQYVQNTEFTNWPLCLACVISCSVIFHRHIISGCFQGGKGFEKKKKENLGETTMGHSGFLSVKLGSSEKSQNSEKIEEKRGGKEEEEGKTWERQQWVILTFSL